MPKNETPPLTPDPTAEAIQQLAKHLVALQPKDPNNLGLSDEKIRELTSAAPAQKYRIVRCRSEETGSTFDAHVVESRDKLKFPHGRITRIDAYKFPEDGSMTTFVQNGGRVPDEHPIYDPNGQGNGQVKYHTMYLQWRLQEFTHPDFRRYNGRALTAAICVDGERGLQTPWLMSGQPIPDSVDA